MKNEKTGLFSFKSPYHKNKELPFLVESDGYVKTVEYKGKTAYLHTSFYSDVQKTIESCKMQFVCSYDEAINKLFDKKIDYLMMQILKAKKNTKMYNRKFDTHRDFHELNEFENRIMPIVRKIQDEDEKEVLTNYIREIFNNQWKR